MSDIDELIEAVAGEDEWSRHRALEQLRGAELERSEVHDLCGLLGDPSATRRAAARMALAALASPGASARSAAQTELRAALGDGRESIRIIAASALGEAGDPAAGPALVEALSDGSANVAAAAADALGELRYGPALKPLTELSAGSDLWVRAAAVVALGRLGDERAIPALGRLAREPGLEKPISEALARIDHPSALPVLEQIGRTAPEEALRVAGSILSTHPDVVAPEWVRAGAREDEDRLRYELIHDDAPAVARLVGLAGSEESIDCLMELLGPPRRSEAAIAGILAVEPEARADAILGRVDKVEGRDLAMLLSLLPPLSDRDRIRSLVPLLSHDEESVRGAAAEALSRAPVAEALPYLAAEMGREKVVPEVVRALGGLGETACASLVPLLGDASAAVRSAAASALVRCASESIAAELRSALEREEDDDARAALLRALARAAGSGAWQELERGLSSEHGETRLAAIEGLGATGDPAAIPLLRETLQGSRADALASIQAIGALATPSAIDLLRPCLGSDDLDVRRAAARAAIAAADALDPATVSTLAEDDDAWIRICAVRILARREAEGRQHLREIADTDPDPTVRSTARQGLGGTG